MMVVAGLIMAIASTIILNLLLSPETFWERMVTYSISGFIAVVLVGAASCFHFSHKKEEINGNQ